MNTLNILYLTNSPIINFNAWKIADIAICSFFIIIISFFICYRIRRLWVTIGYVLLSALYIGSMFMVDLQYLPLICLGMFFVLTTVCLNINAGILRKYLAKSLKSNVLSSSKTKYDKEALIRNVVTAVNWLSNHKVGALITFVKDTPLDDFMKSGTKIDCPFTPEIVETIFYEGTRLHDGAIIVKDNIIVAAAVYYEPSTKPIQGKFGARHRAALGISEVTDAVTIVVSEETGRVCVTHGGLLDNVKTGEFEKYFRNQIA